MPRNVLLLVLLLLPGLLAAAEPPAQHFEAAPADQSMGESTARASAVSATMSVRCDVHARQPGSELGCTTAIVRCACHSATGLARLELEYTQLAIRRTSCAHPRMGLP